MRALAAAVAAWALLGSGPSAQRARTLERVVGGLASPVDVAAPPGDRHRLFVAEQRGRIVRVDDGVAAAEPFLDLTGIVSTSGTERGLLGLVVAPDFATSGRVWVSSTRDADGASIVERYELLPGNRDILDPASATTVLGPVPQPFGNHNGGCLRFGPDGMLYVGLGDGGFADIPTCAAQDGGDLLGTLLRLAPDGTIPPDNPFVGDPGVRDEIWMLGLRNPWRFAFDAVAGDVYVGDVGHHQVEEIDVAALDDATGANGGWPVMEGTSCTPRGTCPPGTPPCGDGAYLAPALEYDHRAGDCSVTAGFVYRGCALPDLAGTFFYGDFCSARLWSLRWDGRSVTEWTERTDELAPAVGSVDAISSFGLDGLGELLVVDYGLAGDDGEVYRLVPVEPAAIDLGFGKPGTGGVVPDLWLCGRLDAGDVATLQLRDGPAGTLAVLFVGLTGMPTPFQGGTLVPVPVWLQLSATTDATGAVDVDVPGGGGPVPVFVQYGLADPGASLGVGLSNALEVRFGP